MNVRRSIYALSDGALTAFQNALNQIKADGSYDEFIRRHHHSMMTATLMPGESGGASLRNVAHRGPAFLPWHRYFCRELELLLQTKNASVTLPYWDWTVDSANPAAAALWHTNPATGRIYVGGDGTGPNGIITTGPFAGWTALIEVPGGAFVPRPGIVRELGQAANGTPPFPTPQQVTGAINNFPDYDTAPWRTASVNSFRNRLEGWAAIAGESGPQLHNVVHVWIGGDMGPGTSPNDPVFFLHHCNVDRIWAQWQHAHPAALYEPAAGGPPGHNLNDTMQHLTSVNPTPQRSLDYRRTLGFIYDTDPPLVELASPAVTFQDVAVLETTWRAAVFRVRAGAPVHLEVVAGSGPAAPYGLTALGGSLTHVPVDDNAPYDTARMWFAFTGEAAPGPAPSGSVQIRCAETGDVFTVALSANTVARPTTGVAFSLDKSGSMAMPAGSGPTRIEVLKEAATRCVQLIRDGSGAGMVSFDHDAYPGLPLAAFVAASTQRADVVAAIGALTPGGATSIGDGVELARQTILAGGAGFTERALVVLTDGLENQPKFLTEVAGSIDQRTFAIGLGTAEQVSAAALMQIANGTGGYILLTGTLTPDTDGYFRLSKYFQQILVSATNENVVTDPSGFVMPGHEVRVPFDLAETDIDATAVLLVDLPVMRLAIETPNGDRLEEPDLTALGAQVEHGTNMTFCRYGLPLPIGAGSHGGTWQVVLNVDQGRFKRELTKLQRRAEGNEALQLALDRLKGLGARYSVTVSSWSNLRLSARLTQPSLEPGARVRVDATLTEFGVPLAGRAAVAAEIIRPDGLLTPMALGEEHPGAFAAEFVAAQEGVWRVKVHASGTTLQGAPFTREQLLTAGVVRGGDKPGHPGHRSPGDTLACAIRCLAADDGIRRILKETGIDPEALAACVRSCESGEQRDEKELLRLG